jgi:hypothetical protein
MHDLSLYLLDLLENSLRAGARRVAVTVLVARDEDRLTLRVEDDGPGLPVEPETALDPFFTTKQGKKTGLGLSLLRQAAEAAGGGLEVGHAGLGGLAVTATMRLGDVDRPPLGDVALTMATMAAVNPEVDFRLEWHDGDRHLRLAGADLAAPPEELRELQEAVP